MQSSTSSIACTYAALILNDEGAPITAEGITKILTAAGVEFEPFWPGFFAKLSANVDINELMNKIGSAPTVVAGGAAPAAGAGAAAAAAPEPEPEEEEEEEADFDLFG